MRLFFEICVFLLPFMLYIVILMLKKRDWKSRDEWHGKPLVILTLIGVVLAFIALGVMETNVHRGALGEVYVPARMENGVFKPAEWVKP